MDNIQSIWINLSAFFFFKATFIAVKRKLCHYLFWIQETFSCLGAEFFSSLLSYNLYAKDLECLMCTIWWVWTYEYTVVFSPQRWDVYYPSITSKIFLESPSPYQHLFDNCMGVSCMLVIGRGWKHSVRIWSLAPKYWSSTSREHW